MRTDKEILKELSKEDNKIVVVSIIAFVFILILGITVANNKPSNSTGVEKETPVITKKRNEGTFYSVSRKPISNEDIKMYLSLNVNYLHALFPEIKVFEYMGFRPFRDYKTTILSNDERYIVYELWITKEVEEACY